MLKRTLPSISKLLQQAGGQKTASLVLKSEMKHTPRYLHTLRDEISKRMALIEKDGNLAADDVEQLIRLYGLKKTILHDRLALLSGFDGYHVKLRSVMIALAEHGKLNQTTFSMLYDTNVIACAESLELLNYLQIATKENINFLLSASDYQDVHTVLRYADIMKSMYNKSVPAVDVIFEFAKQNSDKLPGIAKLARMGIEWDDIVKLTQKDNALNFNNKAYITKLVYEYNVKSHSSQPTDVMRQLTKRIFVLLDKEIDVVPAVVKELAARWNERLNPTILMQMINLAKQNKLPTQLAEAEVTLSAKPKM